MFDLLLGFILFWVGGLSYFGMEILWRGYSHYTMIIVGGISFVLVGLIDEVFKWSLKVQILVATLIITVVEFISGYILNIKMGLGIWDYSNLPFNIMGQVCLPFSLLWSVIYLLAKKVDNWVREKYNKYIRR